MSPSNLLALILYYYNSVRQMWTSFQTGTGWTMQLHHNVSPRNCILSALPFRSIHIWGLWSGGTDRNNSDPACLTMTSNCDLGLTGYSDLLELFIFPNLLITMNQWPPSPNPRNLRSLFFHITSCVQMFLYDFLTNGRKRLQGIV